MIFSLLDTAAENPPQDNTTQILGFVLIGVIILAFVAYMIFSGRKNKASQQEYIEQLEAIRPGHKVKTAGGICGIVVEVCDDNTVIIETGSENSGKSYIKMDKELIAQTDAKGPTRQSARRRRKRRLPPRARRAKLPPRQSLKRSPKRPLSPRVRTRRARKRNKEDIPRIP